MHTFGTGINEVVCFQTLNIGKAKMKSAYCQVECKVEKLYVKHVTLQLYASFTMKCRDKKKNNVAAMRGVLYIFV